MSIFEYDEEKHLKCIREEWRKIGQEEGRKEGEERYSQLIQTLLDAGRNDDIKRVLSDPKYRKQLYQEYGL